MQFQMGKIKFKVIRFIMEITLFINKWRWRWKMFKFGIIFIYNENIDNKINDIENKKEQHKQEEFELILNLLTKNYKSQFMLNM